MKLSGRWWRRKEWKKKMKILILVEETSRTGRRKHYMEDVPRNLEGQGGDVS